MNPYEAFSRRGKKVYIWVAAIWFYASICAVGLLSLNAAESAGAKDFVFILSVVASSLWTKMLCDWVRHYRTAGRQEGGSQTG